MIIAYFFIVLIRAIVFLFFITAAGIVFGVIFAFRLISAAAGLVREQDRSRSQAFYSDRR